MTRIALLAAIALLAPVKLAYGSFTCTPAPSDCRLPIALAKSKLQLSDRSPSDKDKLAWSWSKGEATNKADFGNPLATDDYVLCLYEDGALVQSFDVPAGGICGSKSCWKESSKGFSYKDCA